MFGGASERVPTVSVPSLMRPSLDLSILSSGVTSLVVYLSSVFWSLPWRASVGEALLVLPAPPPQAARETARTAATGTAENHFRALIFIKQITFIGEHAFVSRRAGNAAKAGLGRNIRTRPAKLNYVIHSFSHKLTTIRRAIPGNSEL